MLDIIPLRPSNLLDSKRSAARRRKFVKKNDNAFTKVFCVPCWWAPTCPPAAAPQASGGSCAVAPPPRARWPGQRKTQEVHDAWVETPFRPKPRTAVYPHDQW